MKIVSRLLSKKEIALTEDSTSDTMPEPANLQP